MSLELVSEADESEAAGMSSMITAESVAVESVTEGTSTSKQPPTPPPPNPSRLVSSRLETSLTPPLPVRPTSPR